MPKPIRVTVGPANADFVGDSHLALQAAVDHVAEHGGGTVAVLGGTYRMGNAVHLRSGVRLAGAGERTVLIKNPSRTTRLAEDTDWYDRQATVEDPSGFEAGGGILLRARDICGGREPNVSQHTVTAVDGNVLSLDSKPGRDMWVTHEATASTLFPVVSGKDVSDLVIEDLVIDGNASENGPLNGCYGGCVFLQDCERVRIRAVVARNYNGDGISWQVCHDVTVEQCRSLNHRGLGLHPGSGSRRPVIRGNVVRDCNVGLFWCWGVQHGLAEDNDIRDCRQYGISIGHRDTDNVLRRNRVVNSGIAGLFFRNEEPSCRGAHRNVVESNGIENAGSAGKPGIGIDLNAAVEGVTLRGNRIVNPAGGNLSTGIRIGPRVTDLTLEGNEFSGVAQEVEDRRAGGA